MHPVMAAKQATTIDHITGGRFTLNVVTGWYRPEIEMFGAPLLEHDERYDGDRVARRSSSGCGPRTRSSTTRASSTSQEALAGAQAGAEAASGGDECRRLGQGPALRGEILRRRLHVLGLPQASTTWRRVTRYRRLAREEYGREIQVWTNAYIFQGETEKEARDYYNHCVHAERRLGGGRQPGHDAGHQRAEPPPGVEQH